MGIFFNSLVVQNCGEDGEFAQVGGEELPGAWAWGRLGGLQLRQLHKGLINFSRATSGYRMSFKLFMKVFSASEEDAEAVFSRFGAPPSAYAKEQSKKKKKRKGGGGDDGEGTAALIADAWEVFVTGALFADAPARFWGWRKKSP